MPRYLVSILPEFDVNTVAEAMRQTGAKIIKVNLTPDNKRASGKFYIECSEELATQLQKTKGVKNFEEEILHYPSRN